MSLRLRILIASIFLGLTPLLLLGLGIQNELARRLTAQYTESAETLVSIVRAELGEESRDLGTRLEALKARIAEDNQFRLGAADTLFVFRPYVIDYAPSAMPLMGLSMLQIQDARGRILSSGHFRNEYDRIDRQTPRLLAAAPNGTALLTVHTPEDSLLVLARVDSLVMGGRKFTIVAGVAAGSRFLFELAPGHGLDVTFVTPGGFKSSRPDLAAMDTSRPRDAAADSTEADWRRLLPADRYIVRVIDMPYADPVNLRRLTTAALIVSYPLDALEEARANVRVWLLIALLTISGGTLIFSIWLSLGISRPIRLLTSQTEGIDLDTLNVDFSSRRRDEVGTLSRFLDSMVMRLRRSRERLRDAERRATVGDLARQVNHDLRNGLTPIRNVIRHFQEAAEKEPEELPRIVRERSPTLTGSIEYLESLATQYAKLYAQGRRSRVNVNELCRGLEHGISSDRVRFRMETAADLPPVAADPVALRRVLENLVRNAAESFEDGPGEVRVATRTVQGPAGGAAAEITVSDNGPGIPEQELDIIFNDFYTTKTGGSGLGLSIVRRLVADNEGSLSVESTVGSGTTFRIVFPAAPPEAGDA